ncbi:MAG TPA: hypothetical protein DCY20_06375 [Firmicutes bacterium]|nr:hypothetical protein [Bacillota bacterium]
MNNRQKLQLLNEFSRIYPKKNIDCYSLHDIERWVVKHYRKNGYKIKRYYQLIEVINEEYRMDEWEVITYYDNLSDTFFEPRENKEEDLFKGNDKF